MIVCPRHHEATGALNGSAFGTNRVRPRRRGAGAASSLSSARCATSSWPRFARPLGHETRSGSLLPPPPPPGAAHVFQASRLRSRQTHPCRRCRPAPVPLDGRAQRSVRLPRGGGAYRCPRRALLGGLIHVRYVGMNTDGDPRFAKEPVGVRAEIGLALEAPPAFARPTRCHNLGPMTSPPCAVPVAFREEARNACLAFFAAIVTFSPRVAAGFSTIPPPVSAHAVSSRTIPSFEKSGRHTCCLCLQQMHIFFRTVILIDSSGECLRSRRVHVERSGPAFRRLFTTTSKTLSSRIGAKQ